MDGWDGLPVSKYFDQSTELRMHMALDRSLAKSLGKNPALPYYLLSAFEIWGPDRYDSNAPFSLDTASSDPALFGASSV